MLAQKSPAMKKATLRLLELSADEKARQLYDARLKEQRDIYARERGAVKTREIEIAKSLLFSGDSVDKVVSITGLTYDEIKSLQKANI